METLKGDHLQKLLLTPEEAADVIGIGRSKMYELIGRGEIRSVKIGALRRVPFKAIELFVESLADRGSVA